MGKYFGVMLDMSRDGVMTVGTVKKYVDYLALFGYNMLQLYTEDTYEVDNEPYFGYLRGAYTKDELKEIDAYCNSKGVEFIPCIQTLAHLATIFRWGAYSRIRDVSDILMIDDDRTYELIENMFATLAECVTTRKIHIGMDEAHMVGLGKYLDKYGYHNRFELLNKHLTKVVEIAKKYGFKPMMWSDMFFRISNKGQYYGRDMFIPQELIDGVPEVDLVYWDYYHTKKEDYRAMVKTHRRFNKDVWFAGGAWSWFGFAPSNRYTLKTMKPALDVCREEGVENIFFTLWGDNGKECSYFTLLPSLYYMKRYYEGEKERAVIAKEYEALTGESFQRMMNFDLPNLVDGNKALTKNPSKYMLYADLFFGIFDTALNEGVDEEYKKLARKFAIYAGQSKNFAYLYSMYSKLCKVLSLKYSLGVHLRAAYQNKDAEALKALALKIKKVEKCVEEFYDAFRTHWYTEYKPNGFEVHDTRIGGLLHRLRSCRRRVEEYLSGKVEVLPELEMQLLDFWGNGRGEYGKQMPANNSWAGIVTMNVLA